MAPRRSIVPSDLSTKWANSCHPTFRLFPGLRKPSSKSGLDRIIRRFIAPVPTIPRVA